MLATTFLPLPLLCEPMKTKSVYVSQSEAERFFDLLRTRKTVNYDGAECEVVSLCVDNRRCRVVLRDLRPIETVTIQFVMR